MCTVMSDKMLSLQQAVLLPVNKAFKRMFRITSALSLMSLLFILYLTLAYIRLHFPHPVQMVISLVVITGAIVIVNILVKRYLVPYIIHLYRMRVRILFSPVLILFLNLGLIPAALIPGTESGVFFVILLFTLFLGVISYNSLQLPSLKAVSYFIESQHYNYWNKGNVAALILSGMLLAILMLLKLNPFIYLSLALLVIALIWMITTLRLMKIYSESILTVFQKNVMPKKVTDHADSLESLKNKFSGQLLFRLDYFKLISGDYSIFDSVRNRWYFEEIIDGVTSKNDPNLLPVLKKVSASLSVDEDLRQRTSETLTRVQKNPVIVQQEGIKALSGTRIPLTTEIFRLFRDNSIESKRLAIFIIGKFKLSDLLSVVCESLNNQALAQDAFQVLSSFGPGVEDELIRFYLVNSGNARISNKILQLLGKICTKETMSFLCSRLSQNSRQQKEIIVRCLIDCNVNVSADEKIRLQQLLDEIVGLISWNLTARSTLDPVADVMLVKAIDDEIKRWERFLFDLLSVIYGTGIINKIRMFLEVGSEESVMNALEMISLLVPEPVSLKLIVLFDHINDKFKLKELNLNIPDSRAGRKKILEDILNRDYNLISLWTRACSLRSINVLDSEEIEESVAALLFSQEEILQEEAAYLLSSNNKSIYSNARDRLASAARMRLDRIVNTESVKQELIFEKVKFLSNCIKSIPEDQLLLLASKLTYLSNREAVKSAAGCIVWPIDGNDSSRVHILSDGEKDRFKSESEGKMDQSFYVLPLTVIEDYNFQYPDSSFELLKYIDNNQ